MVTAERGDIVDIHYTVTFKDGSIFDSTRFKDPVRIKLGEGVHFPFLENAVEGMSIGQVKTVDIKAMDAFGPRHEDLVVTVEKTLFKKPDQYIKGDHILITLEKGKKVPAQILDVLPDSFVVDGNPLPAGKDIVLVIEVVNIY